MNRPVTDISRIDKNFAAQKADENDIIYYDVRHAPFKLEGLPWFHES